MITQLAAGAANAVYACLVVTVALCTAIGSATAYFAFRDRAKPDRGHAAVRFLMDLPALALCASTIATSLVLMVRLVHRAPF